MRKINEILTGTHGNIYSGPIVKERLEILVGKNVTVWYGIGIRNSFETQLSINGNLDVHPNKSSYRIYITDGTYCYFTPNEVWSVSEKINSFKDGSVAVIELKF